MPIEVLVEEDFDEDLEDDGEARAKDAKWGKWEELAEM